MKVRLAKWSLMVQEFDMEIKHVKGIANPSDSLNRLSVSECGNVLEIISSENKNRRRR